MTHPMLMSTDTCREGSASAGGDSTGLVAFKNVLVGVDGTSAGRDAIAVGTMLRDPHGRLTLAHVVLAQGAIYRNFRSTTAGEQSHVLLERERQAAGVSAELTGMFAPSVAGGLHQLVEDCEADLLVVGSCARGSVERLLRGDDTQGALRGAACAVAVAPRGCAERPKRIDSIGVAYNNTSESERAVSAARTLAARHGAALRAMTVVRPPGLSAIAGSRWAMTLDALEEAALDRLRSLGDVAGRVTVGPPELELAVFGDELDLLVIGSRGHGPLRRLLLGSTTAHLARSARCPVLVLPQGCRPRVR